MSLLLKILEEDKNYSVINMPELRNTILSIDEKRLYRSKFHGLYHSEKVTFFAYLIGKSLKLNETDMKIILDAAKYHDIGRTDECEDTTHGLTSTLRLKFLEKDEIYQDETNLKLLKAIIEGHCLDDSCKKLIFDNYDLDEKEYKRFITLYNILKDADALDRLRFEKTMKCVLNAKFLRLDFSKQLIDLTEKINREYKKHVNMINQNRIIEILHGNEPQIFYHSIGYNFLAIPSILSKGIISNYYDAEEKYHLKEHAGHNNERWISAIYKKGEAYKAFVKDKIIFEFTSTNYFSGITSPSEAQDLGLPFCSGLYDDEIFIYDKVPSQNIKAMIISSELYNSNLEKINLMNGNIAYQKIKNRLNYYLEFLTSLTGNDYSQHFQDDLNELYLNTIRFESEKDNVQRNIYMQFFKSQEDIIKRINKKLITYITNVLKLILNKDNIQVKDIINYILFLNNINYEIKEEDIVTYTFPTKKSEIRLSRQQAHI